MNQVVTISPDGSLSGLQRKRGKGLDLKQFGHAQIERASEITWNESAQCWHVHILNEQVCDWMIGPVAYVSGGATLTVVNWRDSVGTPQPDGAEAVSMTAAPRRGGNCFLGFIDYDDAVAAEVKFLDAMRVRGIF